MHVVAVQVNNQFYVTIRTPSPRGLIFKIQIDKFPGKPSKKHSASKSSLQEAERLQNGIEKSPSLKSGSDDKY